MKYSKLSMHVVWGWCFYGFAFPNGYSKEEIEMIYSPGQRSVMLTSLQAFFIYTVNTIFDFPFMALFDQLHYKPCYDHTFNKSCRSRCMCGSFTPEPILEVFFP